MSVDTAPTPETAEVDTAPVPTKDLMAQLAKIAAFKGAIADTEAVVRAEATARLLDLHDELGTKSLEVRDAEGNVVVTFVVVEPSATDSIRVDDEDALFDWVLANHPTEIETVSRVKQAFINRLSGEVVGGGEDGGVFHKETGEPVPGFKHVHTPAAAPTTITTKWKPKTGKQAALAMALADGGVTPLAIEG